MSKPNVTTVENPRAAFRIFLGGFLIGLCADSHLAGPTVVMGISAGLVFVLLEMRDMWKLNRKRLSSARPLDK
jgi:hypothetical protein